jgi:hypothetical protein
MSPVCCDDFCDVTTDNIILLVIICLSEKGALLVAFMQLKCLFICYNAYFNIFYLFLWCLLPLVLMGFISSLLQLAWNEKAFLLLLLFVVYACYVTI